MNLQGLATGTYTVQVSDHGQTTTVASAFTVNNGVVGSLSAQVTSSGTVRPDGISEATVIFTNTGNTDIPAPLFTLSADNAIFRLSGESTFSGNSVQFLGVNSGGPAGILPPGYSGRVLVDYEATAQSGTINFNLSGLSTQTTPIDWQSLKTSLQPATVASDAWDAIYTNFTARVGTTAAGLVAALDQDATYLSQIGNATSDLSSLLGFEFQQASSAVPINTIATATDINLTAPGLPLTFTRAYSQPLASRFTVGPLGRGWASQYDITLTTLPSGEVEIVDGNIPRMFYLQPDGTYSGGPGEFATLTEDYGVFSLTESDGQITSFGSNGKWAYIQDPNGNRLTAVYTGSLLTAVVHSDGDRLTFNYNSFGRISSIVDPVGRVTIFSYDPTGQELLQVSGPGGTTTYQYSTATNGPTAYELLSISSSSGTQVSYQYDAQGRVIEQNLGAGAGAVTYSYNVGAVLATDAAGDTTSTLYDASGQIAQIDNALGYGSQFTYDANGNLLSNVQPNGATYTYSYDTHGNQTGEVDPLGNHVTMTYDPSDSKLTSLTDANGHTTSYQYNTQGDLQSNTKPGSSEVQFHYDPLGDATQLIDARGQATNLNYNSEGLLTSEQFSDGTHVVFGYDAHRNLITATDSTGTTTLAYDSSDRLIQITDPEGHYLKFTYDSYGRRTQSVDQTGYTVNYQYDSAGRLAGLTDGQNAVLVTYTYNSIGQLARKDLGNGTFTSYAYDANGQLLHLVNYAPGGSPSDPNSIQCRYDYTYDSLGRETSESSLDGTWSYAYDADGQMTSAAFASTNPAIPSSNQTYVYDAAGNRIRTIINGVDTEYSTNASNQYTSVGGTTYTYDADGNMTSATTGTSTTTYSYDSLNRLVSITTPTDTQTFTYDAFGDLVSTYDSATGQRTISQYDPAGALTDPLGGLSDVTASYDGSGNLISHYVYGAGLVGAVAPSGSASYFAFNSTGSTVGVTGANGSLIASNSYLPYGGLNGAGGVNIPFQFVGQFGVTGEGNGLAEMRSRFYDTNLGRFLSQDPVGITGGINTYAYAGNNPVTNVDPHGTTIPLILGGAAIGAITGAIGYGATQLITCQGFTWGGLAGSVVTGASYGAVIGGTGGLALIPMIGVGAGTSALGYGVQSAIDGNGSLSGLTQAVVIGGITGPIPLSMPGFRGNWGAGRWSPNFWTSFSNIMAGAGAHGSSLWKGLGLTNFASFIGNSLWTFFADIVKPHDPNDKVGPGGYGDVHYVSATNAMGYTIDFVNASTATASARTVTITDTLDSNIDPRTLQLGEIAFGSHVITVPAGRSFYSTIIDLGYQPRSSASDPGGNRPDHGRHHLESHEHRPHDGRAVGQRRVPPSRRRPARWRRIRHVYRPA